MKRSDREAGRSRRSGRAQRPMRRLAIVLAAVAAAAAICVAYLTLTRGRVPESAPRPEETLAWRRHLPETRVLLLFYPEESTGRLRAVPKRYLVEGGTASLMKSALEDLGREPDVPGLAPGLRPGTRIRGVYSQEDGTVFVDLGGGGGELFEGGFSEEIAAVSALTNTVFFNFPHATRLRVLIDGEPVMALSGHLDLSGFLYPDEWLVEGEIAF